MPGTRIYVGGIGHHVRERDIEKFFRGYGRLRDVLMKNGYCFVEFDDHRDAEDAIYELNGKDLLGQRVAVEAARGPSRRYEDFGGRYGGGRPSGMSRSRYGPPLRTDHRIIVENLSSRVSWQDLKDYMRQAGEVTYADAHKNNKNEGVVEFASYRDMKYALEKLDDTELSGRRIKLIDDSRGSGRRSRSRSRRRSSRSRSRSRSYSRSRSRSRSRRKSRSRSRSRSKSDDRKDSKERRHRDSRSVSRDDKERNGSRERSRERSRSAPRKNGVDDSPAARRSGSETRDNRSPSREHRATVNGGDSAAERSSPPTNNRNGDSHHNDGGSSGAHSEDEDDERRRGRHSSRSSDDNRDDSGNMDQ